MKRGKKALEKDVFERQLYSVTTIILTECDTDKGMAYGTASGFYYTITTPPEPNPKGPHWERIDAYWLITNRHVLFNRIEGKEYFIDNLTFCMREVKDNKTEWIPINLTRDEIINRTKLHLNDDVDVVAIDVTDLIHNMLVKNVNTGTIMIPATLTNGNLPDNQPITIDVTSDIVIASYPKGFYDTENKFPIVKSGIVASGWGLKFNGMPLFEIDAQLFPGSSGGLVISKPQNIAMINGKIHYSEIKQFVFLGIYSGEYLWEEEIINKDGDIDFKKHSYGLGNVWYSYLVPEIVTSGKKITL